MSAQPDPLAPFLPAVREWFRERFGAPSPPQALGWPVIAAGRNALVLAPTGSGKTLAAFLWFVNQLYERLQAGEGLQGIQVLYVSPLKALNYDIDRNLEEPLAGIAQKAQELGTAPDVFGALRTAVRTGDTSASERQRMLRQPPHILITTPESLYLILTSVRAREMLRSVRAVIVDEIHALSGNKRGVHLALSLERLEHLTGRSLQRIGLSATQRPLEEIARFLGGATIGPDNKAAPRPVEIVDAGARKALDLRVVCPVDDMRQLPGASIWPAVYEELLALIRAHRSTLIFVNNRELAERITARLNDLAGEELVRTHHGSLSREKRREVEERLKAGELPALVATSSLELGIDIGAIDLVVQVESPKAVVRGLQRVGRSGHLITETSQGRIIPKFRGDLLEAAAVAREMLNGRIEATTIPKQPLDVLAQQVVAMAAVEEWSVDELHPVVRGAYPYRDLSRAQLENVLEMLVGRYPTSEFTEWRPRIVWDRELGVVRGRSGARTLATVSGGTIPDRGYYGVYLAEGGVKLGELEEEFVFETRVGDVFLLGSATWRVVDIGPDRVLVTDARGAPPRIPFWGGEGLGRPYELGQRVGAAAREIAARLDDPDCLAWLQEEFSLDERAALNLRAYLADQREATGEVPSDRAIVVEHFEDAVGDQRIAVHAPFGRRVLLPWGLALAARLREDGFDPEVLPSDDGILFRLSGFEGEPPLDLLSRVTAVEVEELVLRELAGTPLFATLFRHNAERALLLPRGGPRKRTPLWLMRLRAADLLRVAQQYDSFPVVLETYREAFQEVLDLSGLRQVLREIESGQIRVSTCHTEVPSPFAFGLLFNFIGVYMYQYDVPKAERRSQALRLNRELLQEVLGAGALRDLLDRRAVEEVTARLQRTLPGWRARNADDLADLLARLGDLSTAEIAARSEGDARALLADLEAQGRAVRVPVGGEERWTAAEHAPLYRAAARGDVAARDAILRRFARSRGPFTIEEVVARYGFEREFVAQRLAVLQAEGLVAAGEFTPGRSGLEWCDLEALRQIHRRSLALAQQEVEPVGPETYASFLLAWQGVGGMGGGGPAALRRTLEKLQGLALPLEVWERDVLPARVPGYQPPWLDQLCTTGELTWAGAPGGRVAFYLREEADLLRPKPTEPTADGAGDEARELVRAALAERGASFQADLARATGLDASTVLQALWELVWAGEATNDIFEPVRHVRTRRPSRPPALSLGRRPRASDRRRRHQRISYAVRAGMGRWSLLPEPAENSSEQRAERSARLLLHRYGVVARELLAAEGAPLPWGALYAALQRLELRGEVRRGYFVRGLSGAQFALPEAVERLRERREAPPGGARSPKEEMRLISSCDPANPYGGVFPLPGSVRAARLPSSYLVLEGGRPLLLAEAFGRRLTPLAELAGERLARALACLEALAALPAAGARRRLEVHEWDGAPVTQSQAAPALQSLGFVREPGRMVFVPALRRPAALSRR